MESDPQIFIVDDDSDDRHFLHQALEHQGFKGKVYEFENGAELLNNLTTGSEFPELILLDLNMPVKNGFQTLKELRENNNWKDIDVAVLTASSRNADMEECNAMGCSSFFTKPLSLSGYESLASQLIDHIRR